MKEIDNIKNIKLIKGMSKNKVNSLINSWLTLEDDIYLGMEHKHNWKCKCGKIFKRTWDHIKYYNQINCGCVKYKEQEKRYKYEVEKDGEYEYIRSFRKGDKLPNGRVVGMHTYIQVKHKYCGCIYEIISNNFINMGNRCTKCCQKYENSFAYYIEKALGEPLDKYWDFGKNTVNPYHMWKNSTDKVYIKCQDKDYHGCYETSCNRFVSGCRCGYCNSKKVHPLDSFGYKHFDKVMSWHPDNKISPFRISRSSGKKFKFICPDCGYVWYMTLANISNGQWCPQCASSKGEKRITEWLRLNNIEFVPQKEFEGLVGLGSKNLSYDFFLPNHNLLIEYQGEQHEKYTPGLHASKEDFNKQKEHDRRKKEYSEENNINLLEIWYWDSDNIAEILHKIINNI